MGKGLGGSGRQSVSEMQSVHTHCNPHTLRTFLLALQRLPQQQPEQQSGIGARLMINAHQPPQVGCRCRQPLLSCGCDGLLSRLAVLVR